MTNEEYRRLECVARSESDNFRVTLPDKSYADRKYQFVFVDSTQASEFEYQARCLGFSTTIDVHGNVWVGDKEK